MNFAGTPAYTPLSGKSFDTILPAPTIQLFPIVTFGKTIVLKPIKQLSPIFTLPTLSLYSSL